jgi:hypothetical protein
MHAAAIQAEDWVRAMRDAASARVAAVEACEGDAQAGALQQSTPPRPSALLRCCSLRYWHAEVAARVLLASVARSAPRHRDTAAADALAALRRTAPLVDTVLHDHPSPLLLSQSVVDALSTKQVLQEDAVRGARLPLCGLQPVQSWTG